MLEIWVSCSMLTALKSRRPLPLPWPGRRGTAHLIVLSLLLFLGRSVSADPGEPAATQGRVDSRVGFPALELPPSPKLSVWKRNRDFSSTRWQLWLKTRSQVHKRSSRASRRPLKDLFDRRSWSILLYRDGRLRLGNAIPRVKLVRYRQNRSLMDRGVLAPVVFVDLAGGVF